MTTKAEPKQGDLKAWYISPNGEKRIDVGTVDEAKALIKKWIKKDLEDEDTEWNSMGLEIYDRDGLDGLMWQTWYDFEGFDINDIMETEETNG